jgi:hypothetical protein
MNPRYHEIHRVEIKRRLYRYADQQWDALFGVFAASIIFAGFGVRFCFSPIPGSWIIGFVFFSLSALIFTLYRWMLRTLSKRGTDSGWLNTSDQLIIVALICLAIFLPDSNQLALFFFFLCAGAYGNWRLRQNLRIHLKRYYFREAREYIREIERYSPRPKRPTKLKAPQ